MHHYNGTGADSKQMKNERSVNDAGDSVLTGIRKRSRMTAYRTFRGRQNGKRGGGRVKKISCEELLKGQHFGNYQEEAAFIIDLIETGRVKPIKASGTNGKKPALYLRYSIIEEEKDYTGLLEEIRFKLHPGIRTDYYRKHPEVYEKERSFVRRLNAWLEEGEHPEVISVNERSFEIWGREKFLAGVKEGDVSGAEVLKHCGIPLSALGVYHIAEPFACYPHTRKTPQNVLISENLDPFYGMRQRLLEGREEIFGVRIGTLIYGGGKRAVSSLGDFSLSAEPYLKDGENRFLYAGDLDYEGIGIYESLAERLQNERELLPFVEYYRRMLDKGEGRGPGLPPMKEGQRPEAGSLFFRYFQEEDKIRIRQILEAGRYIPQEILNIRDY